MCQGGEPDTSKISVVFYMYECIYVAPPCENGCMVDGMCAMAAS